MIDEATLARLQNALPVLKSADPHLLRELQAQAYTVRLPVNRDVFTEGDDAGAIALLLSGVVRVYKIGETGREITLYRFGKGESCVLTANAILSSQTFPALATVEETAEAVMIPADTFRAWVAHSELWRGFVFDLLSQRLTRMLTVVDEVAFRRMDSRLADLLLRRSATENPLHMTHQEIAADLGSSREVISRILADFAAAGYVHLTRGAVEVRDRDGLTNRALV